MRAGVDFESLVNSVPGGQVQGVEHMLIGKNMLNRFPCYIGTIISGT